MVLKSKEKIFGSIGKRGNYWSILLIGPEAGMTQLHKNYSNRQGDYYLLNGTKNWITNGSTASVYLVIAQTNIDKKHKGINAFIVKRIWTVL